MKSQKILLSVALFSLGIVSCQKDERVITHFTAGTEQSSIKTHLGTDGSSFLWDAGDQAMVYGTSNNNGVVFTATPRTGNAVADLYASAGEGVSGTPYTAILPASIANSATSVTLPSVQMSADGSLADVPMYAVSNTEAFHFDNLCGALKIHLQQENVAIKHIRVKANANISGTFNITNGDNGLGLTPANGSTTTILTLTAAQSIGDNGHDFYIYLPAGNYQNMELTFYKANGDYCTKHGNVTVVRSKYSNITVSDLAFTSDDNLLPGVFTVGDHAVRFSKGNLIAHSGGNTPSAETTTWSFHDEQYGRLGSSNNINYDCDLFGYSTDNTYYGLNSSTNNGTYSGSFRDWSVGVTNSLGTGWRTLSSAEWNYLVNNRPGWRFLMMHLTIGDSMINGMLIFPDGFSWPAELLGVIPQRINTSSQGTNMQDWNNSVVPTYSIDQFEVLEIAGCLFLPTAGIRVGNAAQDTGTHGSSRSSTADGSNNAKHLHFDGWYLQAQHVQDRYYGRTVRLVQEIAL